jgi:hypothetical protein
MSRRSGRALMPYEPARLTLSEALQMLAASGLTEAEAKADVCRALREGKIRLKPVLERVTFHGATVDPETMRQMIFQDRNRFRLLIPTNLAPSDIDWKKSRPKKPWPYGEGYFAHIARLELSANDAREAFGLGRADEPSKRAAPAGPRGEASPPSAADPEDIARPSSEAIGDGEGNPELIAPVAARESEVAAHETSPIADPEGSHSQTSQQKAAIALAVIRRKKAEQWKTWVTDEAPKIRPADPTLKFTQEQLADKLIALAIKQGIDIPEQGSVVKHLSAMKKAGQLS